MAVIISPNSGGVKRCLNGLWWAINIRNEHDNTRVADVIS